MKVTAILWKIPALVGAMVIGAIAANRAGWSGAEAITSRGSAGFITDLFFILGAGRANALVTFNRRDFGAAPARFGVEAPLPREAIMRIGL